MINDEAMATDKLSEGIKTSAKDLSSLLKAVEARVAVVA
jgi:hypothetical protein